MTTQASARSDAASVPFIGEQRFTITDNTLPTALTLNIGGKTIVTIDKAGRVTIADGVSVDEAAKQFWAAVERYARPALPVEPASTT